MISLPTLYNRRQHHGVNQDSPLLNKNYHRNAMSQRRRNNAPLPSEFFVQYRTVRLFSFPKNHDDSVPRIRYRSFCADHSLMKRNSPQCILLLKKLRLDDLHLEQPELVAPQLGSLGAVVVFDWGKILHQFLVYTYSIIRRSLLLKLRSEDC